MPPTLTEVTERIQEQVIELVKTGQDTVVDAVRNLSDSIEGSLPEQAKTSLAGNIPAATQAVDSAFGFAERMLEAQHGFVNRVPEAVTPKSATVAGAKAPKAPKARTTAAA